MPRKVSKRQFRKPTTVKKRHRKPRQAPTATPPIKDLLLQGLHPQEVADKLGITREHVYATARHHELPTNRTFDFNQRPWLAICRQLTSGISQKDICKMHKLAPAYLTRMLEASRKSQSPSRVEAIA